MTDKTPQKPSFFSNLFAAPRLREEKARLEAFLAAVPGEYCGWAPDGSVAYSDGFCSALGLANIKAIHDVQNALTTTDAAALEGMFITLQEEGKNFSFTAQSKNKSKTLRISGARGAALDDKDQFDVLWLEDITKAHGEQVRLKNDYDASEKELLRLQSTLDAFPTPLWMRGGEKREILWCNAAYASLFDVSPADVVAEQNELPTTTTRGDANLQKPGPDMARKALDSGQAQDTEAHIIEGGARKRVHIAEIPLPSSHRTLGFAQDISREEELETQLDRYVAANRGLLEQLGTAIGIYGPDYGLEFYNAAFAQLWGLEEQWLNTKPKLSDIMEKLRETRRLPEQADFKKFKETWMGMFTKLIDPHEDMLYLPDGTALRSLIIPHPMGGLMMTFENVTSRLELESSYNTLIAVQKETLDNLAEGVAVYGGDGRLKLSNPSFTALWNLNPEDLEGEPHITTLVDKMKPLFTEKDWEPVREKLKSHALSRSIQEGRIKREDGLLLEHATVPLPDGGVLISYFDVTDSAKVETALREKNVALETAERLKLDFLANVSYQLRTPLNAIMGFAQILDNQYFGDLNERQKGYTADIQSAGERLIELIDDILDLSTIEAGYLDLKADEFNIYEMLQGLYKLTQDWARKQKLEVKLDCDKKIGVLKADERRVKQVLLNLIRNAIDYTPEGGTITLHGSRKKEHIELQVIDTGKGIPKEEQERIFVPFERIDQGTAERGAGLGLSLVKNIVELHGGAVFLKSKEGKGTTVTITLPLEPALEEVA